MGKFDKDRSLKELAVRLCIARGLSPCLEVIVPSSSDLSDSSEVLTDIDVLGLEFLVDGGLRRTAFDCKTGKMSPISRAFWAAGLIQYTHCDEAYVLLKGKAVNNHRLSAMTINVDIHDERSLISLGETFDVGFNQDITYQSSLDRWNLIFEHYEKNRWSENLYFWSRNIAPLSRQPWTSFRKLIAEMRTIRGFIDPSKDAHVSIYMDALASAFTLWSTLGRDIRRFYQPGMPKDEFEKTLRYYIWGGKDSYDIRQDLSAQSDRQPKRLELPSWDLLMKFSGIIVAAPQDLFGCIDICRNISIKFGCGASAVHDAHLDKSIRSNKRARQFILSLNDYIVSACNIPRDLSDRVERSLKVL